jgi:hypothetical protein
MFFGKGKNKGKRKGMGLLNGVVSCCYKGNGPENFKKKKIEAENN